MKIKKIISLILISLMLFSFSGCKDDEKPSEEKNIVEQTNKTLKIHCYTFDEPNPLLIADEATTQMLRLVFESLIVCDNEKNPLPVLALTHSVSSDALTWSFTIKDGVKWHDGTELTANDVVQTYTDILEYGEESPYYAALSNLDHVVATSDTTLNFKLKNPQANFINLLNVPIVKYHIGEKFNPVGTGPYTYTEKNNKTVKLSVNKDWHKDKPKIENVEVKILPDKDTAVYAYVSKEIDVVSIVSSKDWDEYTSNSDNVIVDCPSSKFNYISINTADQPLSDKRLRVAIAQAIDKNKINSEVLLSHGSVANSCVNSKWWFYNPDVKTYAYNKDKAAQTVDNLKKEMKLGTLNLMVNNDNADKCKAAEMIQANLRECGIDVVVDYVDWAVFTERVNSGNYQMYMGTVKYSADVNPRYVVTNPDEDLIRLLDELQLQRTSDGFKEKYFDVQDKIAEDLQIVPLYFDINSVMYNKRISGNYTPYADYIFNCIELLKLSK